MRPVDYDDRMHQHYTRARAMDAVTRAAWLEAFAARLPEERPLRGLDLGAGTGRLTPALAQEFGPVVGVEPSERMRAIAEQEPAHPDVRYLPGSAERIPLPTGSVDYVLMFLAWHHVADQPIAAGELARVTRPGGTLLLRTQFSDRMPRLWWLEHFPGGYEADASMYDTSDHTAGLLESAGWRVVELTVVTVRRTRTMREELERLSLRGLSTFEQITDAELAEGFERLERVVARTPDALVPPTPATMLVAERA